MEHDVLKHNCIAYLLQDYLNVLGQNFTDGDKMKNFQVFLNENLDKYTALAKFMEQALEWEIIHSIRTIGQTVKCGRTCM